jgi:hypothetical protein
MLKSILAILVLACLSTAHAGPETAPAAVQSSPGVLAPTVEPSSISYSNVSLSFTRQRAEAGPIQVDLSGVQLGLEFSPADHLYLALNGSLSDVYTDFLGFGENGTFWTVNAGVGAYLPITDNFHFVTEVGAAFIGLDLFGQDSEAAFYVTPHFRAKFGPVEAHLGASYTSNELALNEWNGFARLLVEVTPSVDLFAAGSINLNEALGFEEVYGLNLGVRFKF